MRRPLGIIAAGIGLLGFAAPAEAGRLTLGSDLSAAARVVVSQPADTAFWPTSLRGRQFTIPTDGQVIAVRVKGSALREPGAGDPATMIHFQSLEPAGSNGARRIWLSSAPFYMPVDSPGAITTFTPENLCVHKGGSVAFNTIGGFQWGGALDAPLDTAHYHSGTPWQIFAAATGSRTAWFSKDNGTNNGDTMTPTGGTGAAAGFGRTIADRELLMQVVVATGTDRSEPCGGPRRHADGRLVAPKKHELRVAGGDRQRPYVTKDRRFTTGVYCETTGATCVGKALLRVGGRTIDQVSIKVPTQSSQRVPMRLDAAHFRILDRRGFLRVTYVLVSQFGRKSVSLSLNRN